MGLTAADLNVIMNPRDASLNLDVADLGHKVLAVVVWVLDSIRICPRDSV